MPQYIVEIRLAGVGRGEMARLARVPGQANARLDRVARVVTAAVWPQ